MKEKIKISVVGAAGKMGCKIMNQVLDSDLFELSGAIESGQSKFLGDDI